MCNVTTELVSMCIFIKEGRALITISDHGIRHGLINQNFIPVLYVQIVVQRIHQRQKKPLTVGSAATDWPFPLPRLSPCPAPCWASSPKHTHTNTCIDVMICSDTHTQTNDKYSMMPADNQPLKRHTKAWLPTYMHTHKNPVIRHRALAWKWFIYSSTCGSAGFLCVREELINNQ